MGTYALECVTMINDDNRSGNLAGDRSGADPRVLWHTLQESRSPPLGLSATALAWGSPLCGS